MDINKLFPSKWLKAEDLSGHTVKVTISSVVVEEIGNDQKPVVYFTGKEKGLSLNKTNAMVIGDKYGPNTDAWTGHELELYPDRTMFQGAMVDCIRLRIPIPPAVEGAEAVEPPF